MQTKQIFKNNWSLSKSHHIRDFLEIHKHRSNMSAVKSLNPKAEVARAGQALAVNISAAKGLQDVLKSNLGPKGTLKMYITYFNSRIMYKY